jgi:hypothetical protein
MGVFGNEWNSPARPLPSALAAGDSQVADSERNPEDVNSHV